MASDILNALTNLDDLEVSEAQADVISTTGLLLAIFGIITSGNTIFGAISTLIGMTAVSTANDLRLRIAEERFRRSTTTPGPTTTTTTTTAVVQSKFNQKYSSVSKNGPKLTYFQGQCFFLFGPSAIPPGVAEEHCKLLCENQDECFGYRVELPDQGSSKCWIENSTGTSSSGGVEGGPLPC